ncbi:MAG: 5-(carboxyamino)imidazole ribonucleotide synthase [Acidimicrobiia bacterium]
MIPLRSIAIVGGGQLALMMAEAASRIGLVIEVLAAHPDDPAARIVPRTTIGDPGDPVALRELARRCEAVTFDHEMVDPAVLRDLESEGFVLRPGAQAMAVAVDKERQLEVFGRLGLPVPPTNVARSLDEVAAAIAAVGGAAVLKVATGGYDGRGVLLGATADSATEWFPDRPVLVQPEMDIDAEIAVQVVRGVDGQMATYPVVRTVQHSGMCAVVQVPSGLDPGIERAAVEMAMAIAAEIDVVGVLAVEFFIVDGELLLNEIAARPHNSGHITIESACVSQFENHLRAVAGHPLGSTELVVPAAAMVNVVGSSCGGVGYGPLPTDVAVHLYGKQPRPGRKLGHVTATSESVDDATERALRAARNLENGASTP